MTEFGEQLRKKREEKGITQQTLGEALFVTRQAVSQWENGARYPDLLTAKKLAEYFECTLDELLGEDPMKTYPRVTQVIDDEYKARIQSLLYLILIALISCALIQAGMYFLIAYGDSHNQFSDIPLLLSVLFEITALARCLILSKMKELLPKRIGVSVILCTLFSIIEPAFHYLHSQQTFFLIVQAVKCVLCFPIVSFFMDFRKTDVRFALWSVAATCILLFTELVTLLLTMISVNADLCDQARILMYLFMIIFMILTGWQAYNLSCKRKRSIL